MVNEVCPVWKYFRRKIYTGLSFENSFWGYKGKKRSALQENVLVM